MATKVIQSLQLKRGVEASIPTLNDGEPFFAVDTKRLWVGTVLGNEIIIADTDMLVADIAALNEKDLEHDSSISALISKDTSHDNSISTLQTKDADLQTQIDSLVSNDSTQNTKISTLESKVVPVTTIANGLMINTDKSKLDGVATGANNYVHPSTHPPSIIVQDTSNRFVTDTEKSTWNSKASTAVATPTVDGLMDSVDKAKLDGIASSANNYVHPTNHPASIITQDASNRFVTDSEKTTWNGKLDKSGGTMTGALVLSADPTQPLHPVTKQFADANYKDIEDNFTSLVDGVKVSFALSSRANGVINLYYNGVRQVKGSDYTYDGNVTVTCTTFTPRDPDSLIAVYR